MFFGDLTRAWGHDSFPVPVQVKNGYFDFVYEVFVPGMLGCILDTPFKVKDALQYRVLAEFGVVLSLLKQSYRGNTEFNSRIGELIKNANLSMTGPASNACPNIIAIGFQNANSEKDMEMCLKAWKEGRRTE